ncbi:MAG: tRNA uracil 4-sulfurtransferase ThiI [Chloroflexota bacterium]|nr:tRNA uracil 4-sulfurtransferase ThiI [Chloroflexota bacterium]
MGLILIRYGEIGLKGKNRSFFVKRLRRNLRDCLKKNGLAGTVTSRGQRVYVETDDVEGALAHLQRVFGVVSLSPVTQVPANIEDVKDAALQLAREVGLNPAMSFHTAARRADKRFRLTSPEINRVVGGHVQAATGARVDLSADADLEIGVEVREECAFVFGRSIPSPGGLPLGTQGRVMALLSGGIDSPVAAWLMMRRGCGVIPVHFASNEVETAKAMDNCAVLSRYAYGWDVKPIVLDHAEVVGPIVEKLQRIGEARWTCVFCKRALLRKASELADLHGAQALVMGDSLGQVASQTLGNLAAITYGLDKPLLRPLIGMDKTEIVALARRIGTFEVSTRQSQGCPFLPPNPLTRAHLSKLKEIIAELERL